MANPQLENGHTRISNEILEVLMRIRLSPNQWQVLLCVIRKTWGFHKKSDYITNSQIVEQTGLCKSVVSRALHVLERGNLIARKGKYLGFQKDYEVWGKLAGLPTIGLKLAKQLTPHPTVKVDRTANKELAEQLTRVSRTATHKRNYTKETIQKIYGEFANVKLSEAEHRKLVDKWGIDKTHELIEALSEGIASKGYKYKNHYAAILSWKRRGDKKNEAVSPRKVGEKWVVR